MESVKLEHSSPSVAADVGEIERSGGSIDQKPILNKRGSIKDLAKAFEAAARESAGIKHTVDRRGGKTSMENHIKNAKERELLKQKSLEEDAKQRKLRAKERQGEVARKVRGKQLKRERALAEKLRLEKEKMQRERKGRADCFKGRFGRSCTKVKVGKAVQTPYGIGKLVSANGDMYKVDLGFGQAFIPASMVQGTPKVKTPYGNGTIIACKGNMSKVRLSFGDAYVPTNLVQPREVQPRKKINVPPPPGKGLAVPPPPPAGMTPPTGGLVVPPPPLNMPDPTQKQIQGASDFAERKKALAAMMAGKGSRSDLFSPSSLDDRKASFENAKKAMNVWLIQKKQKDKERAEMNIKIQAIVKIQVVARRFIARIRKKRAEREAELAKAIVPIQALARGNIARKKAADLREKKRKEEEMKKREEELKKKEAEIQKHAEEAKKAAQEAKNLEEQAKIKHDELRKKEEEMSKREKEMLQKERDEKELAAKKAEEEAAKASKEKMGLQEEGKIETDRGDDADARRLKELGELELKKPACCVIS